MNLDYYTIAITDRTGAQKALIGAGAYQPALVAAQFDLTDDGGCNELTMEVVKSKLQGPIALGDLITVSAQAKNYAFVQYWKGVITSIPHVADTRVTGTYEARGLIHELTRQRVTKYYEGADIDDVVIDLLADFDTPVTAVSSSTSEIVISSPYTLGDLEAEFDDLGDLIAQLAVLQQNVQYGVDQSGKLYFKDRIATVAAEDHFFIPEHFAELEIDQNLDELMNDVYAQSKTVVGGGLLTIHRDDATSKTAYGFATAVAQIRNTGVRDDVARWADALIAMNKDPKKKIKAQLPAFSRFVFPRGNIRITKLGTDYSFPIKRVTYRLDPAKGFIGSMEVGDVVQSKFEERVRELMRRIRQNNSGAISLTKFEHTRGEEYAQRAIKEARQLGFLNIFTHTVDNLKTFNPALSSHMIHRGTYLMGPFDFLAGIYVSNIIPAGDVPDDIMLSSWVDYYGRIDFEQDADWPFFFEAISGASPIKGGSVDDWRQNEDGLGLEQWQNGNSALFYRADNHDVPSGQTGFRLFTDYKVRFLYRHVVGPSELQRVYSRYDPSADEYILLEIDNTNGVNTVFRLKKKIGGVTSTLETMNLDPDRDFIVEIFADGAANHFNQVFVYDLDNSTLLDSTATYSQDVGSDEMRFGFSDFVESGNINARLGWFEAYTDQSNQLGVISVSRDGGTTFSSNNQMFVPGPGGFFSVVVDVSGQPSGSDIVVRMRLRHPVRVYGWGAAF